MAAVFTGPAVRASYTPPPDGLSIGPSALVKGERPCVIDPRPRTGRRTIYLLNGIIAALLLVAFAMLSIGLGSGIYRCDVLQIPNCH